MLSHQSDCYHCQNSKLKFRFRTINFTIFVWFYSNIVHLFILHTRSCVTARWVDANFSMILYRYLFLSKYFGKLNINILFSICDKSSAFIIRAKYNSISQFNAIFCNQCYFDFQCSFESNSICSIVDTINSSSLLFKQ